MTNRAKEIIIEEFVRLVELSVLDKAEDIALQAHSQQYRKVGKKPYYIHPKRVQLLAKSLHYGLDVQIVALLHDVIEDAKNPQYYHDMIKSKFGNEILNAILLLSHDKDVPYMDYLQKLVKSSSPIAKLAFKVKMLDMTDNLTDAPSEKQKQKYKDAIETLIADGMAEEIPKPIYRLLHIEELLQEAPKPKPPKPGEGDAAEDFGPPPKEDNSSGQPASDDAPDPMDSGGDAGDGEDLFGDEPGGGGGLDGGPDDLGDAGPEGDAGPDAGGEDLSIVQFNDKLKTSKKIDKQKTSPEPGFEFGGENDFYNDNYVGQTPKGSLLIGVPNVGGGGNTDLDFINKVALPKIIKVAYEAMKSGREVVMLGDYGLPYYEGKYSESVSGYVAKVLNEKFKGTIKFDTWNPQDYYAFTSNTGVWKDLKARTEAENPEMKAALYLFLLATDRTEDVVKKLKTDDVNEVLGQWGFVDTDPNMQVNKEDILRVIFPDTYSNPETKASYIIKTYLQLLRVNMLRKVIQYEKDNKVVIIPTDANTSWSLNNSFKELDNIQQSKKEPVGEPKPEANAEVPEDAPEAGAPQNAEPKKK